MQTPVPGWHGTGRPALSLSPGSTLQPHAVYAACADLAVLAVRRLVPVVGTLHRRYQVAEELTYVERPSPVRVVLLGVLTLWFLSLRTGAVAAMHRA